MFKSNGYYRLWNHRTRKYVNKRFASHHAAVGAAIRLGLQKQGEGQMYMVEFIPATKNPALKRGKKIRARWIRKNANGTITVAI